MPIVGIPKDSGNGSESKTNRATSADKAAATEAADRKNATKAEATENLDAPSILSMEKYFLLDIQTAFEKKNAAVHAKKKTAATASEAYAETSSIIRAAPDAPQRKLRILKPERRASDLSASVNASASRSFGVFARIENCALERVVISGTETAEAYETYTVPLSSPNENPVSEDFRTTPSAWSVFQKNGRTHPDAKREIREDSERNPFFEGTVSDTAVPTDHPVPKGANSKFP